MGKNENKLLVKFIAHIRKYDDAVVLTSFAIFLLHELFELIPLGKRKGAEKIIENWLPDVSEE